MKIEYLKTQLKIITGLTVKEVLFDQSQIVNVQQSKLYPYVLWDLNTYRSIMSWGNTSQEKETIKMKAYCVGYLDKDPETPPDTDLKESQWDILRDAFREYLTKINTNSYLQVTNMSSMNNELFEWGFSVDSEIAVSFDVELQAFCNVSV